MSQYQAYLWSNLNGFPRQPSSECKSRGCWKATKPVSKQPLYEDMFVYVRLFCLHMFYVKNHIKKLCHDVIPVVSSPCPANKGRFVFFEIKQLSRAQGMRKGPQETAQLHTPGGPIVNCRVSGLMKG